MFLGHFGLGLAAKRIAPKTSLGTLWMATQLADLLWPAFLLLGWEGVRVDPGNTAVTPLDFYHYPITHSLVADLGWATALAGSYWLSKRYKPGAVVLFLGGIFAYSRTTRARNARGRFGLAGVCAFLGLVYLGSLFGPPPPNQFAIAITTLSLCGWIAITISWPLTDRDRASCP